MVKIFVLNSVLFEVMKNFIDMNCTKEIVHDNEEL
jgi:hypothetical protein